MTNNIFKNQDYKFFNGTKKPHIGTLSGTGTPYSNRDTIQFFGLLT
jgi:hypothetical protein